MTAAPGGQRVIYLGLFLSPTARAELRRRCVPAHALVEADHVTLAFRPGPERLARAVIGQRIRVRVVAGALDERAQAVEVTGAPSDNAVAHITVSRSPGTPAVYSNELLARGRVPVEPFDLDGVVDVFPRSLDDSGMPFADRAPGGS